MRRCRLIFAVALGLAFVPHALPQEAQEASKEAEAGDSWIWWKWANFLILAGGLGYLIGKNAPAFFKQRSEGIEQAIRDAAQTKKNAEARAAEVEARFTGLQKEIENLRTTSRAETAAEGERITKETAQHLEKIKNQEAQEMILMTRAARNELRKYSAGLALELAENRIRSGMNPETQDRLVDGFLQDLRNRVPRTAAGT
jgi:F-type H+-transporting ATPase subunit b